MPEEDIPPPDQRAPEDTTILPTTSQSSIQLLDQKTHHTISTHSLQDPFETILCISAVNLETSEHTHAQQDLIAIGTAILKGEDTATIGRIYIYSIIPVVPDPDSPYPAETTSKALKLLSKEEVRGPVTALCGVGTQGFLLVAQGQKVMVRGLKEDGSFLPVAFLDMQCYVTVTKELGGGSGGGGEGLCLLGDAVKGLWLTGYMVCPEILLPFKSSLTVFLSFTWTLLPNEDSSSSALHMGLVQRKSDSDVFFSLLINEGGNYRKIHISSASSAKHQPIYPVWQPISYPMATAKMRRTYMWLLRMGSVICMFCSLIRRVRSFLFFFSFG